MAILLVTSLHRTTRAVRSRAWWSAQTLLLLLLCATIRAADTGTALELATLCSRAAVIVEIEETQLLGDHDPSTRIGGRALRVLKGHCSVGEQFQADLGANRRHGPVGGDEALVVPTLGRAWLFAERQGEAWRVIASGLRLITSDGLVLATRQRRSRSGPWFLAPVTASYLPPSLGPYDAEACHRDIAAALAWAQRATKAKNGSDADDILELLDEPGWYRGERSDWDEHGRDLLDRYAELVTPAELVDLWLEVGSGRRRLRQACQQQLPGCFSSVEHLIAVVSRLGDSCQSSERSHLLDLLGRCRLARPQETAVLDEHRELLLGIGAVHLLAASDTVERHAAADVIRSHAEPWWIAAGNGHAIGPEHPAQLALARAFTAESDPDERFELGTIVIATGGGPAYHRLREDPLGLLATTPAVEELIPLDDGSWQATLGALRSRGLHARVLVALPQPPVLQLVAEDGAVHTATCSAEQLADWCVVARRRPETLASVSIGSRFPVAVPEGSYRASIVCDWQDTVGRQRRWSSLPRQIEILTALAALHAE